MKNYRKGRCSTKKSLIFSLFILFMVQVVLNCDFWNWGPPKFYLFGWMTPEYAWRIFLIAVVSPLSYWLIIRLVWPIPDKEDIL